jgi:CrcB protein
MLTTVRSGPGAQVAGLPLRILAIAAGGSLGTLARYGLGRALAPTPLGFPWPTLLANVTGSLLLGLVVTLVVERWPPTRFVRPFAAIGFCGGFTTFSTVMVEAAQQGRHGRVGPASIYLAVTVGAGLLAAALGIGLARRGLPARDRPPIPDPDDLGALHAPPDRLTGPDPRSTRVLDEETVGVRLEDERS